MKRSARGGRVARVTTRATSALALLLASALLLATGADCHGPEALGCLGTDDPTCVPPTPCAALAYTCEGGFARQRRVAGLVDRPPGIRALAAKGDWLLENDRLVAVVDAIDHPNHLAATGGNLLDLAPRGGEDELNQAYAVTGILPRDAVRYVSIERVPGDTADASDPAAGAAIVARGHLDGDARVRVITRYEVRPCEPGVRIRTEVFNGGRDAFTYYLADVYFWGDRGATPFVPLAGHGFVQPPLDLKVPDEAWRSFPWMAASAHLPTGASYAALSCTRPLLEGVDDSTISAAGLPRAIIRPGDGLAFERFVIAAPGPGLSAAASLAVEAHAMLHGGDVVRVHGRVVDERGAPLGADERAISLAIDQGEVDATSASRVPASEVVPGADGSYTVSLPAGARYRVEAHRLGRPVGAAVAFDARIGASIPDVVVTRAPSLDVSVTDGDTGAPIDAELVLVPRDDASASASAGSLHGVFAGCAPFLGVPDGASPACNRALVHAGHVRFTAPPARYWVYATGGPARTLARVPVDLAEGDAQHLDLALRALAVFPSDATNGDFHVHGGRSFDTGAMADETRVLSFASAGVDVIVSTDHDVISDYADAVHGLGLEGRLTVIAGAETTQMIPWLYPPGIDGPTVIGHFNFWPLRFDPNAPRNGLPSDEFLEPGALFDQMRPLMSAEGGAGDPGVAQLNHPLARSKIFRDEGYLRMMGYRPTKTLPMGDDGSSLGRLWARPAGGARNLDWDVQETMNGADVLLNLAFRAQWHAFLSQGVLRAGTANSDSHSLRTESLGYPRNVVLRPVTRTPLDRAGFDAAVRRGELVGTNGPFVDAAVVGAGTRTGPSIAPFRPGAGAQLEITVRAAPWIPVDEIRIVVNGKVARRISGDALSRPSDPFGTTGLVRYTGTFALADLVGAHDGWIVVEAGLALPATSDDDGDGLPDRFGAPGDGTDVRALPRATQDDARFHVDVVAPGTWPFAYTNPFVIDLAGDGWTPPGP
jgi:hypothetical protein